MVIIFGMIAEPEKNHPAGNNTPGHLPGSRLKPLYAAAIILIVAVLPFLNIFRNNFVRYDDDRFILENSVIREFSFENIIHIMNSYSPSAENPEACPLTRVTWALNYNLHGYEAWGFQLGNLLLHALSCLLLFFLLRAGPWGNSAAFWGTLLFAVHPVHVESVTWMTARKDVLSAALSFASILAYLRFTREPNKIGTICFWLLSMLLWTGAVYAKPTAVAVPALIIVWITLFIPREKRVRALGGLAPAFAAAAFFTWTQVNILSHYDTVMEFTGGSFWTTQFTNGNIILRYIFNLAAPIFLNVEYWVPDPVGFSDPRYLWSWVALLPIITGFIVMARKKPALLFFPAWFIVALAPFLQFVPTNSKMADRYLYIPSVAFCLLVGVAAVYAARVLSRRFKFAPPAVAIALVLLAAFYAAMTFQRNSVWKDDAALFLDSMKKNPHSYRMANNLGKVFLDRGQLDEAERLLRKSLDESDEKYAPLSNLGTLFIQKKDYSRAIEYYNEALVLKPDNPGLIWNLQLAYLANDNPAGAFPLINTYFQLRPDDIDSRGTICRLLGEKQLFADALPHCESYIRDRPVDIRIIWAYSNGLFETGEYRKAITAFKHFIDNFDGNVAPAFVNVGVCLYMLDEYKLANAAWLKALEIDPHSTRASLYLERKDILDKLKKERTIPVDHPHGGPRAINGDNK